MKRKVKSLIAGIIALAMVFCMLPARLFAAERSGGIHIDTCPETLPGCAYITDGRNVTVTCGFPCKLGYMSDGEYVSVRGMRSGAGSVRYYVPYGTDELALAAVGDASGDGAVTNADSTKIKAYLKETVTLTPEQVFAADVNHDGKISNADSVKIKAFLMETNELLWDAGQYEYDAYAIAVSADASATEIYAAWILYDYLNELGIDCAIIGDDQPFDRFVFCIGDTAVYDISEDIQGKAPDSYVIAPFNGGLAIFGAGGRGTLYGVHTFLEDFCGFKCYAWYPVMIKTSDLLMLPEEKIEYEPFFEYRNTDWRSGWMSYYSVSHLLNGCYQSYAPEQGGNVPYLGGGGHTLSTVFCAAEKYFGSHPEYFALRDGQRVPGQLCLTNSEVYGIVLEEVLGLLEEEHDPAADLQIISLSQADNLDYCECESCRAIDDANGSHAGTMIAFVNSIAEAVKEAGYSNVAFDTLAYRYTRKAPSQVRPDDNVIVRLCTFECCFSHSLGDAACDVNREVAEDLAEWSEICDRIYIWDYTTNFAFTLGIFPDFRTLQSNMQFFYENGVMGVYEEGNYYVDRCDTEFGELRTFLIAELLEDPYCDYDAKMLEFCGCYYGEGGKYVKEIIDELTDCIRGHMDIYCRMGDTFNINEEEAEKIDGLWTLAEGAAEGSDDALAAVKRSRLSWRYVKAVLGLGEFAGTLEETRDAREALYNDLIAHDVKMIDEWTWIEDDFSEYEMIPVEEWEYAARFFYLIYDMNGGTGGPQNQWSFIYFISYDTPTREGYSFLGWATVADAAVPEYLPGQYIDFNSDLTLYAVWEEAR